MSFASLILLMISILSSQNSSCALTQVLFDLEGYHDSDYIYPVGYKGTYGIQTADEQVSFHFEICYDGREGGGPAFVVTVLESSATDRASCLRAASDSKIIAVDPDTAWERAFKKANKKWPWKEEETPKGHVLYGLTFPEVLKA